jgi:hypothetical protein
MNYAYALGVSSTMNTPTPNNTISRHVFTIPELVWMIGGSLEKPDQAALLQVCRQLYDCMKPLVWETVHDAVALLKLIPGAEVIISTGDPFPACTVSILN